MSIVFLKQSPKAFSICCFVASAAAYFFGKVRFILGEAAPDLSFWNKIFGKKNPKIIVDSKNVKILSENNEYWGLSEMDDGSPFFCWVAAALFVLGVLALLGALLDSSSASYSSSENSDRE